MIAFRTHPPLATNMNNYSYIHMKCQIIGIGNFFLHMIKKHSVVCFINIQLINAPFE